MTDYVPLFQEKLQRQKPPFWPFWMMVGCVLVNRATWAAAEPIHRQLMRHQSPRCLLAIEVDELVAALRPLGFQKSRAGNLRNVAKRFTEEPAVVNHKQVLGIVGLGEYAADTWAIFVEGRLNVKPKDKRLRQYLAEQRRIKREQSR